MMALLGFYCFSSRNKQCCLFVTVVVDVDDRPVRVEICDTAGQVSCNQILIVIYQADARTFFTIYKLIASTVITIVPTEIIF